MMTQLIRKLFLLAVAGITLSSALVVGYGRRGFSGWAEPVNLGVLVNSAANDQHPAISKDGLSLYFISSRPGGLGGQDIYVSQRESPNDTWGPPVNLGPNVNSANTENAPALSRNGRLLFFGSTRLGGCGGLDLWVARRRNKHDDFGWEPTVNLGCTINTAYDEDGPTYFRDEENGVTTLYFTSLNRPGNIGDYDIYASTLQADGTFGLGQLIPELCSTDRDTRTSISRNGLEMFITSNRAGGLGGLDLWVATRASTCDTWSVPANVGAPVNTAANDGAPALSFDGTTLYFYSTRPGGYGGNDLYVTTRARIRGHLPDEPNKLDSLQ